MKLTDAIKQLEQMAKMMGPHATLELFDRTTARTLKADPDTEQWDFEILRGDACVVIEFE